MTGRADVSTSLPPPAPTSHTSNISSVSQALHEAQLCQSTAFHRCLLCDSTLLLKTSLRRQRNKQKESKHSQQLPLPSGSTHSAHVVLWAIFSPGRRAAQWAPSELPTLLPPHEALQPPCFVAPVLNTCKLFLCCSAEQPPSLYSIQADSFLISSNILKYEGDLGLYFVHAHYPIIIQSTNTNAKHTQSTFRKYSKLCEHKRSTNRNRTRKRKERRSTADPCTPQLSAKTESSLYRAWDLLLYCAKGVKSPHSGTEHLLKLAVKSVNSCKSVAPSANRKPVCIFLAQEYGELHVQIKHLRAKEKTLAKGVTLK